MGVSVSRGVGVLVGVGGVSVAEGAGLGLLVKVVVGRGVGVVEEVTEEPLHEPRVRERDEDAVAVLVTVREAVGVGLAVELREGLREADVVCVELSAAVGERVAEADAEDVRLAVRERLSEGEAEGAGVELQVRVLVWGTVWEHVGVTAAVGGDRVWDAEPETVCEGVVDGEALAVAVRESGEGVGEPVGVSVRLRVWERDRNVLWERDRDGLQDCEDEEVGASVGDSDRVVRDSDCEAEGEREGDDVGLQVLVPEGEAVGGVDVGVWDVLSVGEGLPEPVAFGVKEQVSVREHVTVGRVCDGVGV